METKFNQYELTSFNKFLKNIKESFDKFSVFYMANSDRSLIMMQAIFIQLKNMEVLCLSRQIDCNIYSCQLSRALIIVTQCILNSEVFNNNFEVFNTGTCYQPIEFFLKN